ncbi:hypothetical protein Cni_G12380 [Canna indica]|uniref:Uncharacterized protein n=1 Tax=Canna indica TaxID=4628 RepID=A0AAQ3QCP4_9LILI|nr:hypothetical protein Cni_G12380 [Canna indica]
MEEKIPRKEGENEEPVAAAKEEAMGLSERRWRGKGGGGGVMLEGYVVGGAGAGENRLGEFAKTRSLTDDDLEELKGCLDLGFGFSYEVIPELRNTLPALELCYSMIHTFHLEDPQHQVSPEDSHPVANWRISSPGDDPDEVKARLKYWAQAVACTLKLCS